MSKAQEYHDQSVSDLEAAHGELRKELYQLIAQKKVERKLEQPHRIPETKKKIARLLTVLHAKRSAQTGKGA
jgi:ribosomal protein L29